MGRLIVLIVIFLMHELDFVTAFISGMPSGYTISSKSSTQLKIARVGTEDGNNVEITKRRKEKDSALAADSKQLATAQKASTRLKLGEDVKSKWDTKSAPASIVQQYEEAVIPISGRQILIKKKKDVGKNENIAVQSSSGEDENTALSPSRSLRANNNAAEVPEAVTVSDTHDIFDTIMIASLETEKAGKAEHVRELYSSAQTPFEKLIGRRI